jgi:gliding motility-associated-like protein
MQRELINKSLWLLLMAFWPVAFVAGQTRHVVMQGMEREYRVNRQPGVTAINWFVYTDSAYTTLALPEQAELISKGEGFENEIKVHWLATGNYYLMVTMFGEKGCVNKKAWPFTVKYPAKFKAYAICNHTEPWIRWEASAEGFNIGSVNIKMLNTDGNQIGELLNAPVTGSAKWPDFVVGSDTINSSINLVANFNDLPGDENVTVNLDLPDCYTGSIIALNDTITVWHGVTTPIDILFNDFDTQGDLNPSGFSIVDSPTNGAATINPVTGQVEYTPVACFFGTDSIVYVASNISGAISNEATVIINVEINPYIDSDNDSVLDINENVVGTDNLCDTDTDMDGLPNFLDNDDDNDEVPTVEELGDLDENGVPDYLEDWNSRAVDDKATTSVDVPIWISALENDSTTMVPATLHIIVNPTNGYVNINNSDSRVNYYPGYDFMGEDSFIYVVCDHYNICDTALVVVTVEDPIITPQVFTPNDDGYNERYFITGLERYPENEFVVFNRWGNKVYERKNYANDWDGTSNSKFKMGNKPLPVGVYYYILKYAKNRVKQGGLYLER